MNTTLNGITVWPGCITSYSSMKFRSKLIKAGLGKAYKGLTNNPISDCPTHNGLIVEYEGELFCGDSVSPVSKLTPFGDYEKRLMNREIGNLQLFEVANISKTRQEMASNWWIKNVLGTKYDAGAYFCLIMDALFGIMYPGEAGDNSKFYCTEGIEDAYKEGAGYDLYENENPNPYTTIKMWKLKRLNLL